jgi:DNA-binding CsgD family transcriptional regulator
VTDAQPYQKLAQRDIIVNQRIADADRYHKQDKETETSSFALSYVEQHGAPFTAVVSAEGKLHASDHRAEFKKLLDGLGPTAPGCLPELLVRIIRRKAVVALRTREPAMTLIEPDIVVGIMALESSDDGQCFACWLWRVNRNRILDRTKRRYGLTTRELQLLSCIIHGAPSAEIARTLCISSTTVEWHTKRLLVKTESQNRTEMTARVLGWLPEAE